MGYKDSLAPALHWLEAVGIMRSGMLGVITPNIRDISPLLAGSDIIVDIRHNLPASHLLCKMAMARGILAYRAKKET